MPPGVGLIAPREVVGMALLAPHHSPAKVLSSPIPETCLPGEGASPFCGVLRVVAARRRLCRAAGPGASPHARLARQSEAWSGERRPEGAALNKYGKSNHARRTRRTRTTKRDPGDEDAPRGWCVRAGGVSVRVVCPCAE